MSAWAVGLDAIPEQWTALVGLRTLQLRGHTMLLVRARAMHLPLFVDTLRVHLILHAARAASRNCLLRGKTDPVARLKSA